MMKHVESYKNSMQIDNFPLRARQAGSPLKSIAKRAPVSYICCMRDKQFLPMLPTLGVLGALAGASVVALMAGHASEAFVLVGTQGLGKRITCPRSAAGPRINVLEVDAWKHSLDDGSLRPVAKVPFARKEFIRPEHFSPDIYRQQIETLDSSYTRQRDVLMYYGGVPGVPTHHGLNFNAWSTEDLGRLRELGGRPFIGLETMDRKAVEWMADRLHAAGYGPLNRIYVRICAEPSGMAYGSEDGTARGKRHTQAAYASYQRRFTLVASWIHALNLRDKLDFHVVFAGTNTEDFTHFLPSPYILDALGYDLYVTPENKERSLRQIRDLRRRFPGKPLVIPELGIATTGPGASPKWAEDALGDVLMALGRHPGGVAGITVFSVNAARRMPGRRWNWAWTPMMFEMLKEWESAPRRWRKEGFHDYDPLSYPVGRDVLYVNRQDLRIVYRKLAISKKPGVPWFFEARLILKRGRWIHRTRQITLG